MAVQHAKAAEIVDLRPLGAGLKTAKTTAIIKSETFEAMRLIVLAGASIPAHQVSGAIMLHCLEGCIRLVLPDTTLQLSAGQWVYLDGGARHSLQGVEDSSLLLTILLGG